jgi:hypothetical protein
MLSDKIEPKDRDVPDQEVEDNMGEDIDDSTHYSNMR